MEGWLVFCHSTRPGLASPASGLFTQLAQWLYL